MPNQPEDTHKDRIAEGSPDLRAELRERLRALAPEAFSEGKLDADKLKALLGEGGDAGPERYSFSWAGKRDAIAMLQLPTRATLKPDREHSVNFDEAQHVFIEGENLEVLKVLYRSYFGRVKMIYIDPPYNTGNDFIYPDDFADPLDNYLRITGQKNGNGDYTTSQVDKNGRIHSAWLSMMYPRLVLARQFLNEDGAIFISINDSEAKNLSKLMDEIFGEENFVAQLVWQRSKRGDSKLIANVHEYVLVYARNKASVIANGRWRLKKDGVDRVLDRYNSLRQEHRRDHAAISDAMREWYGSFPKDDPSRAHRHYRNSDERGLYFAADFAGPDDGRKSRPRYDILHPTTGKPCKKPSTGWRWDEKRTKRALAADPPLIHFGPDETTIPCRKTYLEQLDSEPFSSVFYRDGRAATLQVEQLLCPGAFDFPKNTDVIEDFLEIIGDDEAIILDFFAGSGATAQAVFDRNTADGGQRKFVLVQLPERMAEPRTLKDGTVLQTIADVARERIKRAALQLDHLNEGNFRAFRLAVSNTRPWSGVAEKDASILATQIEAFADSLVPGWKPESVIWEVALREGYGLTSRVERIPDTGKQTFWCVSDPDREQSFVICLDDALTLDAVRALKLPKDALFVCRDTALDDTLSANLALQCRLKVL
jgi:adenine-specific DNA-methyltransferase